MTAASRNDPILSECSALRRAFAAERTRGDRYHQALRQANGRAARRRVDRQLSASIVCAAQLAMALVDSGEPVPLSGPFTDFDDRLLDAMDAILGDQGKTDPARITPAGEGAGLATVTGRKA